nr:hypothetical protein [Pseudobdellovibrionaceae bacterium]
WFLYTNLIQFTEVASTRGDIEKVQMWGAFAESLQASIEQNAWDGEWYRRAYYDDGTPLGSASQKECQIDSLSQTWAVISGAASEDRAQKSMESLEKHLIKKQDGLVLLFTPPFENTELDPGYIKGYLPGVRENGGQYTHAAIWSVIAFAMRGEREKAMELFSMLNPINHGRTAAEIAIYKVEPYVMVADVYSQPPYKGRGGWTWYTGSSAWMYRAGMEYLLGFQIHGNEVSFKPCVPSSWKSYQIHYKFFETNYTFIIKNSGASKPGSRILMVNDQKQHTINIEI